MSRFRRVIDEGAIWVLGAPLSVWAGHFLLCYWVAAIWCAKGWNDYVTMRTVHAGLTIAALLLIASLARLARSRYRGVLVINEAIEGDSGADRNRFLGHVALMLAVLAALAVVMTWLPTMVFRQC